MHGRPATREMDLWRISSDGGQPEQLTRINTDIAYPTPIDERTILFVAHDQNGAGPWLWAFDVETRTSQRVSSGSGAIYRSGSRGGWSASGRECRELSGQLVERSDYQSR